MKKLLHIVATPRDDGSRTLQVTDSFLEAFQKTHTGWVVDELNLAKEKLPELNRKRVDGKYVLLSGKDLFGEAKESWNEIVSHIERFLAADAYLISTPMWNFSIPYALKQYIDIIVQPKYLFRYTESGAVEGLVKNKKMLIITSRGGEYASPQMRGFDHQEPYLRTIFGFVGITDINFVIAQPMDMGQALQVQKIEEAQGLAKKIAVEF